MTAEYVYAFAKYQRDQEAWVEMHRKRRLFFKSLRSLDRPDSRERREAEYVAECCERHPELAEVRRFVLDFYAIMDCKDAAMAEMLKRSFVRQWAGPAQRDRNFAHVVGLFKNKTWFARLFPFTAFENASRTTNSTERANRWFRKRQKTHYRNRKEHTIRNMLHADLIYRRDRLPPDVPPVSLRRKTNPLQGVA